MMALESKAIKITVEGELTEVKDLMEHSNMMMQVDVKEGKNDQEEFNLAQLFSQAKEEEEEPSDDDEAEPSDDEPGLAQVISQAKEDEEEEEPSDDDEAEPSDDETGAAQVISQAKEEGESSDDE